MDSTPSRPDPTTIVEELLEAFAGGGDAGFSRCSDFGGAWFASGGEPAALAREIAAVGRVLEERLLGEGRLDALGRKRLADLIAEAEAHSIDGFVAAGRARRDGWLSYYTHEMRNALNTLVNAHWILKNSEGKQTAKVMDMADRAVRRLEAAVKGVRDLELQAVRPAPGKND